MNRKEKSLNERLALQVRNRHFLLISLKCGNEKEKGTLCVHFGHEIFYDFTIFAVGMKRISVCSRSSASVYV